MPDDDASIDDGTELFRRLHPKQVIWDDNLGRPRATSDAFRDFELSINVGDDLRANELPVEFCLRNHAAHHLACVTAAFARGEEQKVWRDPLVDDPELGDDPTHGIVEGTKSKARRDRFAKEAAFTIMRLESLKTDIREAPRCGLSSPVPGLALGVVEVVFGMRFQGRLRARPRRGRGAARRPRATERRQLRATAHH